MPGWQEHPWVGPIHVPDATALQLLTHVLVLLQIIFFLVEMFNLPVETILDLRRVVPLFRVSRDRESSTMKQQVIDFSTLALRPDMPFDQMDSSLFTYTKLHNWWLQNFFFFFFLPKSIWITCLYLFIAWETFHKTFLKCSLYLIRNAASSWVQEICWVAFSVLVMVQFYILTVIVVELTYCSFVLIS